MDTQNETRTTDYADYADSDKSNLSYLRNLRNLWFICFFPRGPSKSFYHIRLDRPVSDLSWRTSADFADNAGEIDYSG
jgi:hypothetical protein